MSGAEKGVEEHGDLDNVTIDPKEETKLLAKLDLFFVPVIMLVYLSCFLDRSNIGTRERTDMLDMLDGPRLT